MMCRIAIFLLAFAWMPISRAFAGDGPAKDVPELQALANYVGHWDVVISSRNAPHAKGEVTAEWILDGRFVQQTGFLTAADGTSKLSVTTLMTYDPVQKSYRTWQFFSNGHTNASQATWDEANRTMTSLHRGDGLTTKTTARFRDAGSEEWSIVTTNASNEVVFEATGTNTRRKE